MERFDGRKVWAKLSLQHQEMIGTLALELVMSWWLQDQAHEADQYGNSVIGRAAEAADRICISLLKEEVGEALHLNCDTPHAIPSVLGPVCRVCGCSQEDGCDIGCGWAENDLCTACVSRKPDAKQPGAKGARRKSAGPQGAAGKKAKAARRPRVSP